MRQRGRQLLTGTWDAGDSWVTEVGVWLGWGAAAWPGCLGKGQYVLSGGQVPVPAHCAFDCSTALMGGIGCNTHPVPTETSSAPRGASRGLLGLACLYSGCQGRGGEMHTERGAGLASPALAQQPCLYHSSPWHMGFIHCKQHGSYTGRGLGGQSGLFAGLGAVAGPSPSLPQSH